MHHLKTHTTPTNLADTFKVYWTNTSKRLRGVLTVQVRSPIADSAIAAELSAMQYLLEDQCVIGENMVGSVNTQLIVSQGAIRKLQRRGSDKAHLAPYASFLVTRFAACKISVAKDTQWFDNYLPELAESLLVEGARCESVHITGLGKVVITRHALMRFAERNLNVAANDCAFHDHLPYDIAPKAWRKLVEAVSDSDVHEVYSDSIWKGVNSSRNAYVRQKGRYFLNPKRNLILVIVADISLGMTLVTIFAANSTYRAIPAIATARLALTAA